MSVTGSSVTGETSIGKNRSDENFEENQSSELSGKKSLLTSVFGVLFTLSKEKDEKHIVIRWVLLKVILDFWQLFTAVVKDGMNWDIDMKSTLWAWVDIPNFNFLQHLGYNTFVALLYLMVGALGVNVVLCVYVAYAFQRNQFDYIWPIQVLRIFSSVFFQAFDVASINLLQIGFTCRITGFANDSPGHLEYFPEVKCSEMPQMIHTVVSGGALVLFMILASLLNMAEVEVNPFGKRPAALGHSSPEIVGFLVKAILTTVDVFIGYKRPVSIMYLLLALYHFYIYFRWSPHFVEWMNHMKVAVAGTILYVSALTVPLQFVGDNMTPTEHLSFRRSVTYVMFAGIVPTGVFSYYLSYLRMYYYRQRIVKAFSNVVPDTALSDIYDFASPQDVEIAARLGRVWTGPKKDQLDKEAVELAGNIVKAGLACFPNNSYSTTLYANYLMEACGLFQAGRRQLEVAAKQHPSVMVKFMLFVREQEATQRAAGGNAGLGGGQLDLVSYVEYHRKHRLVIHAHKDTLVATSQFWQLLQGTSVSFNSLSRALSRIDASIRQAELMYRSVLEQYSSNIKLLRLYARFLETVRNDPRSADFYYAEANKLEELHGRDNADDAGILALFGQESGGMADGAALIRSAMDSNAIAVVANAYGIIQMVNKFGNQLLGYKKGELEGKTLSILMPQPYSSKHAGFLKKYIARGDDKIGTANSLVTALTKEGYGLSVTLGIAKVSGIGEDSVFMGLLEPQKVRQGTALLWSTPNGFISSVDATFSSTFGYHPFELMGMKLSDIVSPAPIRTNVNPQGGRAALFNQAGGANLGGAGALALLKSVKSVGTVAENKISTTVAQMAAKAAVLQSNGQMSSQVQQVAEQAERRKRDHSAADTFVEELLESFIPPPPPPPHVDEWDYVPPPQPTPKTVRIKHKYYPEPVLCKIFGRECGVASSVPMWQLEIEVTATTAGNHLLLVSDSKGNLRYMSGDMAALLGTQDKLNSLIAQGGYKLPANSAFGTPIHANPSGVVGPAAGAGDAAGPSAPNSFKLFDFMPFPWNAFHSRWTRDLSTMEAAQAIGPSTSKSCRTGRDPSEGPVLTMVDKKGKLIPMRVSVMSKEEGGEVLHLVRASKALLEDGLSNLRLKLKLSESGVVLAIIDGGGSDLFGFNTETLIGQPFWACVELGLEAHLQQRAFAAMVRRAMQVNETSWPVAVLPPDVRDSIAATVTDPLLAESLIATRRRPAVLQLDVTVLSEVGHSFSIVANLWASQLLSGVVEIDMKEGKIRRILEQELRPSHLIFGMPTAKLIGKPLSQLIDLGQHPALKDGKDPKDLSPQQVASLLLEGKLGVVRSKGVMKSHSTVGPPSSAAPGRQAPVSTAPTTFFIGPTSHVSAIHVDGMLQPLSLKMVQKSSSVTVAVASIRLLNPQAPKPDTLRAMLMRRNRSSINSHTGGVLQKQGTMPRLSHSQSQLQLQPNPRRLGVPSGDAYRAPVAKAHFGRSQTKGSVYGQPDQAQLLMGVPVHRSSSQSLLGGSGGGPPVPMTLGAFAPGKSNSATLFQASAGLSQSQQPSLSQLLISSPNGGGNLFTAAQNPMAIAASTGGSINLPHSTAELYPGIPTGTGSGSATALSPGTGKDLLTSGVGPGGPEEAGGAARVNLYDMLTGGAAAANEGGMNEFERKKAEQLVAVQDSTFGGLPSTPDKAGEVPGKHSLSEQETSQSLSAGTDAKQLNGYGGGPDSQGGPRTPSPGSGSNPAAPSSTSALNGIAGLGLSKEVVDRNVKDPAALQGADGALAPVSPRSAGAIFSNKPGSYTTPNTESTDNSESNMQLGKDKAARGVSYPSNAVVPLPDPRFPMETAVQLLDGSEGIGEERLSNATSTSRRHSLNNSASANARAQGQQGNQGLGPKRPSVGNLLSGNINAVVPTQAFQDSDAMTLGQGGSTNMSFPPVVMTPTQSFMPNGPRRFASPSPVGPNAVQISMLKDDFDFDSDTMSRNGAMQQHQQQLQHHQQHQQPADDPFGNMDFDDRAMEVAPKGGRAPNGDAGAGGDKGEKSRRNEDAYSEGNSSSGESRGSDHASNKRYRKLLRIITTSDTVKYMKRFNQRTMLTTVFIVIVHVVAFSLFIIQLNTLIEQVLRVSNGTHITGHSGYLLIAARAIDQIMKGKGSETLYNQTNLDQWVNILDRESHAVKASLFRLYDDTIDVDRGLFPFVSIKAYPEWVSFTPTQVAVKDNTTLMQMGSKLITSSRIIFQNFRTWVATGRNISNQYDFQYILYNNQNFRAYVRASMDYVFDNAVAGIDALNHFHLAFLMVEGCGLALFTVTYISYLLSAVAERRYRLYEVFMTVPVGLSKILALRTLHQLDGNVDSDDEDDDDDEEEAEGLGSAAAGTTEDLTAVSAVDYDLEFDVNQTGDRTISFPTSKPPLDLTLSMEKMSFSKSFTKSLQLFRVNSIMGNSLYKKCTLVLSYMLGSAEVMRGKNDSFNEATHRHFKRDSHVRINILWPFLLFSCILVGFYSTGLVLVSNSKTLLANQNVVNYTLGRMLNAIAGAHELCATDDRTLFPSKNANLLEHLLKIKNLYYVLVQGDKSFLTMGPKAERFPLVTTPITDDSTLMNQLLYGNGHCLRLNRTACPDINWPYYQVSTMGINTMMTRLFSELDALLEDGADHPEAVNLSNSHLDYAFNIGLQDLYDALNKISNTHEGLLLKPYKDVIVLHVIVLILCVVGCFLFVTMLLNPLHKKIKKETHRIAELLSQLPRELDMTKVLSVAVNRMELQVYVPRAMKKAGRTLSRSGSTGASQRGTSGPSFASGNSKSKKGAWKELLGVGGRSASVSKEGPIATRSNSTGFKSS